MKLAQPITLYGLLLRPLADPDIEQVRLWRNAQHVRSKMAFQAEISAEMQAQWWSALSPLHNHYYIIEQAGLGIGVIHAKNIDWDLRTAETGIFIGESQFMDSFVPVLAVLALMDTLFEDLNLLQLFAKVKTAEAKTMAFNQHLGYQVISSEYGFSRLAVDAKAYYEKAQSLRAMASRLESRNPSPAPDKY